MRWLALALLLIPAARAAVDGAVVNRTTGKPQPGAIVTLYGLGGPGGMKPVKTVKTDDKGAFSIDAEISGPHLLQTIYSNVLYNEMLQPGVKTSGLELAVYESSNKPASAKVAQHMIIVEPLGDVLHVNESFVLQNTGNTTYNDPANGTLQVFLPEGVTGEPRVMITAPQGMPLQRPASPTGVKGIYKIDFPVKPGDTRFDVTYVMPLSEKRVFASKVLHNGGPIRIIAPQGVTLTGDSITLVGQEPKTQAKVYDIRGKDYSVQIEGSGQLGPPEPEESGGGGRGIQSIEARIYDQVYVVLGLALFILLLSFVLLYRRGAAEAQPEAKRR